MLPEQVSVGTRSHEDYVAASAFAPGGDERPGSEVEADGPGELTAVEH
jgi:hypothetical protein